MTAPLRILFVFADPGRIRYFEPALELMAERGHRVHIAVERLKERIPGQLAFAEGLAARHPGVTLGATPSTKPGSDPVALRAQELRLALDFLHYRRPQFDGSPHFRERSQRDAPAAVVQLADEPEHRTPEGTERLRAQLAREEQELPPPARVVEYVREQAPDLVLVTPLLWFGAPQTGWVRAARLLGIPVAGCLFSWDNLTSKGSLRDAPDLLTVWNEAQRHEAELLHGVPPGRIAVTGAQNWDGWFALQPRRTRAELLREAGLDPTAEKLVVWVESSGFVGGEAPLVQRWAEAVRRRGGPLSRAAALIVRPHPQVVLDDGAAAAAGAGGAAVLPPRGQVPLDGESRQLLYDTLHHADAVVGVNTSAFIECAIQGRPCLTLQLPELAKAQSQTVHFHHLLAASGGPLLAAPDLDGHLVQLEEALAHPGAAAERARAFVERFVRPFGSGVPAAPRFVDAVEGLAR